MENGVRDDHRIHIGTTALLALGLGVIMLGFGRIILVVFGLLVATAVIALLLLFFGVKGIRRHVEARNDSNLLDGEPELDSPYRNDPRDRVSPPSDPEELL